MLISHGTLTYSTGSGFRVYHIWVDCITPVYVRDSCTQLIDLRLKYIDPHCCTDSEMSCSATSSYDNKYFVRIMYKMMLKLLLQITSNHVTCPFGKGRCLLGLFAHAHICARTLTHTRTHNVPMWLYVLPLPTKCVREALGNIVIKRRPSVCNCDNVRWDMARCVSGALCWPISPHFPVRRTVNRLLYAYSTLRITPSTNALSLTAKCINLSRTIRVMRSRNAISDCKQFLQK